MAAVCAAGRASPRRLSKELCKRQLQHDSASQQKSRRRASRPTMRPTTLLLALLSTSSAVQIVSYDDGVDEDALVDIRVDAAGGAASFLQETESSPSRSAPTAMLEPNAGLAAFSPARADRLMKNTCCNADGCCDKPKAAQPPGAKAAVFSSPELAGMAPSFLEELDVRASFLETDSSGRLVQHNKVCCGGGSARTAGGAGPGGDQFAAASVPAVPCVCTMLSDTSALLQTAEGGFDGDGPPPRGAPAAFRVHARADGALPDAGAEDAQRPAPPQFRAASEMGASAHR